MRKLLLLICLLLVPLLALQAQTVSVTFQVDMTVQIAKGAFNPATQKIWVRGSLNDWGQTEMSDAPDDGDSVYTVTVAGVAQDTTVQYK
ncbi:MAG: hypothetical protein MN733_13140, partial [Nitrososphaera sp.]|nr:hypothetical protein [Nitrososphaera sp.]